MSGPISRDLWVNPELALHHGLTRRHCEVLCLVAAGLSNSAIGSSLFLSEDTVKNHVRRIFALLRASSRAQVVAVAYDTGLLRTRVERVRVAEAAGLRVVS